MKRLIIALAVALCGCATSAVPTTAATPVPAERILDARFLKPAAGTAEIVVKRDSGMLGGRWDTRLSVDWEPVADLRPSEVVVIHVPAGDHILSTKSGPWIAELRTLVRAGTRVVYRTGLDPDGGTFIMTVAD